MNSFGRLIRLTTFGESHGTLIGGVLDGFPSGVYIDMQAIQEAMHRRRPGYSRLSTPRKETDEVEFVSGIFEGCSTGAPITFFIRNENQQSADYDSLAEIYRPGHADYTYQTKYGLRDHRGGGRASARETAVRVVAGAICQQLLSQRGIKIHAFTSAIGDYSLPIQELSPEAEQFALNSPLRTTSPEAEQAMSLRIEEVRTMGDSVGGVVSTIIRGVPAGWGEPIYDKLSARLASAMMSINAAKGFEIGDGFELSKRKGSETNDPIRMSDQGEIQFTSNHMGGILGGISTGQEIRFSVAFKPVSSISLPQQTITQAGENRTISINGRHDPCVVPRAVAVVEAMTALVLADFMLLHQSYK